jgi:tRNA pseudouridine55 synthase
MDNKSYNGLLAINKDIGPTSHDTLDELRNILNYRKIGHIGTLDPGASGVLVFCLGDALKIVQFLMDWDKEYLAKIKLGEITDTYDAQGIVIKKTDNPVLDNEGIRETVLSFKGQSWQTPPLYSAIRHQGKRLYQYARKKEEIEIRKKKVEIKKIEVKEIELPYVVIGVTCSKGTYIRSLAYDIGEKLGCGAHLFSLCRTRVGPFELKDVYELDEVKKAADENGILRILVLWEQVFRSLPAVVVTEEFKARIENGPQLKREDIISIEKGFGPREKIGLKDKKGTILAIGEFLVSSVELFRLNEKERIFQYLRVLV